MTPQMSECTFAFFAFLYQAGIPDRTIREGANHGVWLPLAKLLRACKYRDPGVPGEDLLSHIDTCKMLIAGKLSICIEMSDFCRLIAPFCEEPVAQQIGVTFMNEFLIPQYKAGFVYDDSGDELSRLENREDLIARANHYLPGLGNTLAHADVEAVIKDGQLGLAVSVPDPDDGFAVLVAYFLNVYPEWQHDVMRLPNGEDVMTLPCTFAFSKWYCTSYGKETAETIAFRQHLFDAIIDAGGDFGPMNT